MDKPICADCGMPYGGFGIDLVLKSDHWDLINDGNKGLLLCANCIMKRASEIKGCTSVWALLEIQEDK